MSEWMRVSVCVWLEPAATLLSLSLPCGRIAVPLLLTRPPLFMYGNGNPSCPLPVCLLWGPQQSTYSPTLSQPLHVINLPPAERGRSGWQTTRKAIFISSLQPPNCRLAFIQFSPAPSLSLPLSSQSSWIWLQEGNGKDRFVRIVAFVGFWSQVHTVNHFKLRIWEIHKVIHTVYRETLIRILRKCFFFFYVGPIFIVKKTIEIIFY